MAEKIKKIYKKSSKIKQLSKIDLGLGGLFKGLEKLINLAQKVEAAGGEIRKEGKFEGSIGGREIKGSYGFSVRTGLHNQFKKPNFNRPKHE